MSSIEFFIINPLIFFIGKLIVMASSNSEGEFEYLIFWSAIGSISAFSAVCVSCRAILSTIKENNKMKKFELKKELEIQRQEKFSEDNKKELGILNPSNVIKAFNYDINSLGLKRNEAMELIFLQGNSFDRMTWQLLNKECKDLMENSDKYKDSILALIDCNIKTLTKYVTYINKFFSYQTSMNLNKIKDDIVQLRKISNDIQKRKLPEMEVQVDEMIEATKEHINEEDFIKLVKDLCDEYSDNVKELYDTVCFCVKEKIKTS